MTVVRILAVVLKGNRVIIEDEIAKPLPFTRITCLA